MKAKPQINSNPPLLAAFEHKRDAYGFAVRPQHVQRYREYENIYREEEEERSDRWKNFLERQSECAQLPINGSSAQEHKADLFDGESDKIQDGDDGLKESEAQEDEVSSGTHRAQIWAQIRPSLRAVEDMMNARVKRKISATKTEKNTGVEEDSEDEFYDLERSESDTISEVLSNDGVSGPTEGSADVSLELSIPWKQELEFLVQGGLPMAVRGELWQAFVGVKGRHIKNYYQNLLLRDSKNDNGVDHNGSEVDEANNNSMTNYVYVPEKWKLQIEKDLPRTFPGHPALDEGGRDALRRILTAYARHNPSVGYCQAMNFFAALLLLLMPEENAFWALLGILDDYFEGYFSEEMIRVSG